MWVMQQEGVNASCIDVLSLRKFLSVSWTEIKLQFFLPSASTLPFFFASSVYMPLNLSGFLIFISCMSFNLVLPSVFFPFLLFALFTLRGLLHPHLFLCEREYLFQRQERKNAASGQKGNITTLLSIRCSLHPLLLFTGIHADWIYVNEGHLVAD